MICPQNDPSAATIPDAIASGRSSTVPRYDRSIPTASSTYAPPGCWMRYWKCDPRNGTLCNRIV